VFLLLGVVLFMICDDVSASYRGGRTRGGMTRSSSRSYRGGPPSRSSRSSRSSSRGGSRSSRSSRSSSSRSSTRGGPYSGISRGGSRWTSAYVTKVYPASSYRYHRGYTSVRIGAGYWPYYSLYGSYSGRYHRPDSFKSEQDVCVNYEAYGTPGNNSVLGVFVCPLLPNEPGSFTACCGDDYAEFCCENIIPHPLTKAFKRASEIFGTLYP